MEFIYAFISSINRIVFRNWRPMAKEEGAEQEIEDEMSLVDEYRRLKQQTEDQRQELISLGNTSLVTLVKKANEMVPKIQAPQERLLDAELFESLMHCTDMRSRRLSIANKLQTPGDLVMKVKEKYRMREEKFALMEESSADEEDGENEIMRIDWGRLGKDIVHLFNSVPAMKCMFGFINVEKKIKQKSSRVAPRQKRMKLPTGKAEAPTQRASREVTGSATDVDRTLMKLRKVLEHESFKEGIGHSQLTLDHDSYTQTAMNIFCCSFLVRDGQVALKEKPDGTFLVIPVFGSKQSSKVNKCKQLVVQMTLKSWEADCAEFPREMCKVTNAANSDEHNQE